MQYEQQIADLLFRPVHAPDRGIRRTVDSAPSPSTPRPGFYQRMQSTIKTQVTYYRMRNAMPPMDFAPETFPREAAEIYRQFMSALNRVDRSKLRDILTERMFSRFKSHLPDKKELIKAKKSEARQSGQERSTSDSSPIFVTGACSIVQARAVQIAAPVDTIFVQVTCEVQVLQPARDVVRVVYERPISTEGSRWRICDLIR
jgi:hypothetical protein